MFFNDTATAEIYTLSLHDALPICKLTAGAFATRSGLVAPVVPIATLSASSVASGMSSAATAPSDDFVVDDGLAILMLVDRKSTRLNSSHANISYAVFCL